MKIRVGDICRLKLPNGLYAFGRVFKDAAIGVYSQLSDDDSYVPIDDEYMFIVGIYNSSLRQWEKVGHKDFTSEEESWPPPEYTVDPITKRYSIYYKGVFTLSSYDECKGLEEAAVWENSHIIDRIMGNNKWQNDIHRH